LTLRFVYQILGVYLVMLYEESCGVFVRFRAPLHRKRLHLNG
jgi:hypothetical protein